MHTEFTDDETAILRLLAQDKTNGEIMKELDLTEMDLIEHFRHMRPKVVGGKYSNLVRYAKENVERL